MNSRADSEYRYPPYIRGGFFPPRAPEPFRAIIGLSNFTRATRPIRAARDGTRRATLRWPESTGSSRNTRLLFSVVRASREISIRADDDSARRWRDFLIFTASVIFLSWRNLAPNDVVTTHRQDPENKRPV